MKKKLLSAILSGILILSCVVCYTADIKNEDESSIISDKTYEDIFAKDNIFDINIEINDADLQDMFDYAINEEYHSADITVNGTKVENAGIRTKGNMTLSSVANSDSDRYSFRIKFNKYVKKQTCLGLDELCLNNCYSDPTYMREYLHYEILEKLGMNVPKRAYCNVYINGELFGFYLAVEALDDTFLEREFGEQYENGNLYKMDMGSTLEYKEDENYTYADHKSGSDKDLGEFKEFVKKLNDVTNGEKGDIESFLNVDSALKYIAANTVLCNYDSYNGNNHHNFYLYQDEAGVFTVIPWDFNMSFGGFNGNNSTVGIDTPIISGSLDTLPLIGKLLSVDEYKERYYEYIKEIMTMLEDFEARVDELKATIKPYIENDPTSFYSIEDFEKSTTLQSSESKENDRGEMIGKYEGEESPRHDSGQEPTEGVRNVGEDFRDERGRGDRQPFGGTGSIINCVKDRLENLKGQFNGTAEKSTETSMGPGGGRHGENFAPPEAGGGNDNRMPKPDEMPNEMPKVPDGVQQPPNNSGFGERPDQPMGGNFPGGDVPPNGDFQGDSEKRDNPFSGNGRPGNGFPGKHNSEKNDSIRVHVNGHIVSFDTLPFIENDTTLVGFRAILEALGATVDWNEATETVTAVKDDTTVVLNIGSDTAYVNGKAHTLLAAPVITENSTMIPVRFISERLGMKVSWDDDTKLITILSK